MKIRVLLTAFVAAVVAAMFYVRDARKALKA